MKKLLFVLFVIMISATVYAKNYDYSTDTSLLRNNERADSLHGFDALHYDLEIDISMNDSIYGVMTMDAVSDDNLGLIELELEQLNVIEVKVDEVVTNFNYDSHIISIPVTIYNDTHFRVQVTYNGTPVMSNDGYNLGLTISNSYAYTMSDPSGVRWWMPAYDHPWDKATIDYHVKIRDDWLVACNGVRTTIQDVPAENKRIHNWVSIDTLALHVACITAADFNELNTLHNGLPIQNFVTDNILTEAAHDFADMPFMIDTYSSYFGDYPFEKYGNTVVPIQTFGAMEHQTMTTLGSGIIDGQSGGEHTIAHELSHQWFGNCLTPLTWKDVWLSEGFAVLSEAIYDEARYGHESMVNYIENNIHNVYKQWANSNGPRVIYDPVYSEFFAPPSYEKAASVLLALRAWVGEQTFKHILQTWFSEYKNKNVVTQEFIDLIKRETDLADNDVDEFFNQWIFSDGLPGYEYIILRNNDTHQVMPVVLSNSTTQTQFKLKIPLIVEYLNYDSDTLIVDAGESIPDNCQAYDLIHFGVVGFEMDPDNLIIATEKREHNVNLEFAYASNNSVLLDWDDELEMFEIDGYNVYRKESTELPNELLNGTPVTESFYIDTTAVAGIEYIYTISVSKDGFSGAYSNQMTAVPSDFTMDQGILVIDETIDVFGMPGYPTDNGCDYFYDRIIDYGITELDYNAGDSLNLDILGQYSVVIVHDDDNAIKRIEEFQSLLAGYVVGGGNLIISGWGTADYIDRGIYSLLGLSGNLDINDDSDFSYAASGEYSLTLDYTKMSPSWNQLLNGIIVFPDETENDGFIRLRYHGDDPDYNNQYVVAHKEFDAGNHIIMFGFPLYYTLPDGTNQYMDYILNNLGIEVSNKGTDLPDIKDLEFAVSENPVSGDYVSFSMKNLPSETSEISIYNIKGQRVYNKTIDHKQTKSITWNMKDDKSKKVASGVYFARFRSGNIDKTTKFIIMK